MVVNAETPQQNTSFWGGRLWHDRRIAEARRVSWGGPAPRSDTASIGAPWHRVKRPKPRCVLGRRPRSVVLLRQQVCKNTESPHGHAPSAWGSEGQLLWLQKTVGLSIAK